MYNLLNVTCTTYFQRKPTGMFRDKLTPSISFILDTENMCNIWPMGSSRSCIQVKLVMANNVHCFSAGSEKHPSCSKKL